MASKILIADDEEAICDMISFALNESGYQTFVAYNAEDAIRIAVEESVDLILSDVRMPKGGGRRVLSDIKKRPDGFPKIILITGYSDLSEPEALAKGASAVFLKPVSLEELMTKVQELLVSK